VLKILSSRMEHPQPYSGGGASRKFEYGEPDGDKHVVATPIWLIAPRAIQFIFAIAVLALCASDSDINAKVSKFGIAVVCNTVSQIILAHFSLHPLLC